jgi:hypothetical protein
MLSFVAGALLVAAALAAIRWWLTRVDAIGRPRPFPVFSVTGLALLGGGLFVPVLRHAQLEHRLDSVASVLVGAPVTVHCQSLGKELVDVGPELGFVRYGANGVPEHSTLIKREVCSDLRGYLGSDHHHPSDAQVVAVHVLSHESMHMAGSTDEAQAECFAVQRDAQTARLMGASSADAVRLARTYWLTVYPRMPEGYRSADCAPGGALDRRSPDAPWLGPAVG